eukprot:319264_1
MSLVGMGMMGGSGRDTLPLAGLLAHLTRGPMFSIGGMNPHTYEALLALDEGNVERGVSEEERRRHIQTRALAQEDLRWLKSLQCQVCQENFKAGE